MLTNEQEEIIGEALLPLFQYLEHSVIVDVAQRILATMAYSRTAEIEAQRLQQLGFSPAKIRKAAMKILQSNPEFRKAVAKNTLEHKKTVKKLLREILKAAEAAGGQVLQEAADLSYLDDLRIWKQSGKEITDNSYLPQLVEAIRKQTSENMASLAGSTGFKTMSGFEAMENLYRRELDKAMIKVCTGTFSREQVVYDTVHSLADSGLRTIDFSSGYSMQLDTAVKLAIRTGSSQIAAKIMDENIDRTGENLVYVSKHWGARNAGVGHANHELWQGRVYYIKAGENYSEEAKRIGQDYITDLWRATGYSADGAHENDPLGLHGYNCRHKHYVWFIGSSLPDEDPQPDPVTINGKTYDYYQITQKMRSMERKIRALKREREALAALGQDTKEISKKIKQKIKDYQDFCKGAKIKPDINRLRYECKTSDLTKTDAWKRYNDTSFEGSLKSRTLGAADKVGDGTEPVYVGQIDTTKIEDAITFYSEQIRNSPIEKLIVIDKEGYVYYNEGVEDTVSIGSLDISDCTVLHNHPASNGIVSFGHDDFKIMQQFQTASFRLANAEYDYRVDIEKPINELSVNQIYQNAMSMIDPFENEDIDMQHLEMEYLKREGYIRYVRKKVVRKTETGDRKN